MSAELKCIRMTHRLRYRPIGPIEISAKHFWLTLYFLDSLHRLLVHFILLSAKP